MTMLIRAVASASVLLAACSPAGAPASAQSQWEVQRYREVCAALWRGERTDVLVGVSNVRNVAGINVVSDGTAFAEEGRFESDVRLAVNGTDIPVTAVGIASGEFRGLLLRFDPLPLIRRHPDGFRLVLSRGAAPIESLELKGASTAFSEVMKCAETLPRADAPEEETR
jgi:hypothetical protein